MATLSIIPEFASLICGVCNVALYQSGDPVLVACAEGLFVVHRRTAPVHQPLQVGA